MFSLRLTAICVLDEQGRVVLEGKAHSPARHHRRFFATLPPNPRCAEAYSISSAAGVGVGFARCVVDGFGLDGIPGRVPVFLYLYAS